MPVTLLAKSSNLNGPAASTTPGVVLPTWTHASNQIILLWVSLSVNGVTFTVVPSGFTQVFAPSSYQSVGTVGLWYKIAAAGDVAAVKNWTLSTGSRYSIIARVYGGVHDTLPIDGSSTRNGGSTTAPIINQIDNLAGGDDLVVYFGAQRLGTNIQATFTAPSRCDTTDLQSVCSNSTAAPNAASGAVDRQLFGPNSVAKNWNSDQSAQNFTAAVALRSAAALNSKIRGKTAGGAIINRKAAKLNASGVLVPTADPVFH